MPTLKEIRKNLETNLIVKNIVNTYQEIANLRMKQIREKVLKNREFFRELLNTYQKIKLAYIFSLKRGLKEKEVFSRRTQKENVTVFLSANKFFYGALVLNIWKEVEKYLEKRMADLVVVGKTGKYLAERSGWGHKMYYFELDDIKPEEEKIGAIIEFIKSYKKIIVFNGKYKGALVQKPAISDISGEPPFEKEVEEVKAYLFEPSPEAVLDFFETEIMAVLFHQTILEHQLARYASRVMAMYQATERAKILEKKLIALKNKLEKQKFNKEQIEYFGSLKL